MGADAGADAREAAEAPRFRNPNQSAATAHRPGVVLAVTACAAALTGIGLSSISVLFPELRRAFPGATSVTLSWVANVFTIVGAATLIPAGALADRTGRKRMVLIGVAMFIAGSILGAVAPNPGWLIAARFVQALGASCYTPASAALLVASYPPDRVASAIGIWAVTGGLSSAIGPPLAGLLVEVGDWRTTFWFNVPIGLLVFALGTRYLQESDRDPGRRVPDPFGTVLVMAAVSPIVFALVQAGRWGWSDARTLGWISVGLAITAVFVLRCARHDNPLIELSLFRLYSVRISNLGTFVIAIAWFCVYWAVIQFVISEWGWSATRAGLATSPVSFMSGFAGLVVGRFAPRTGHRVFILPGSLAFIATAIACLTIGEQPSVARIVAISTLMGCASGCVFPSFIAMTPLDVPASAHAVASGVNFMVQRIGTTIGVALAIAFVAAPTDADRVAGLHRAVAVTIASAVVAFLIGLAVNDTRRAKG